MANRIRCDLATGVVSRLGTAFVLTSDNNGLVSDSGPDASAMTAGPDTPVACGWCGSPILLPARGRVPKWCSSSCRHRAWELTRAAASGRAAVQIVDRVVEVDKPSPVIEQVLVSPRGPAWPNALAALVAELDTGRVYDRDLPALADALGQVLNALDRRPGLPQHPRR
jgi:hypothetical protein